MTQKELALYKLRQDFHRSGSVEAVFLADVKHIDYLIENEIKINYGEILGKHSEVYFPLTDENTKLVTSDPVFLALFKKFDLESGNNPLEQALIGLDETDLRSDATEDQKCDCDYWSAEEWLDYLIYNISPE